MKYWLLVATIFLLVTSASPLAHAAPEMSEKSAGVTPAYQEKGTRDVSQNAWSSWSAPVSTVNPSQLVSSDSADSTSSNGVTGPQLISHKAGSFQFADALNGGGKPVRVEKSKPIQEVEIGSASTPDVQSTQSTHVVAVAAPKSGSNYLLRLLGAFACLAVLSYRRFRRANAGPNPRKPSFL